jgi:signal transduction histidine kinase
MDKGKNKKKTKKERKPAFQPRITLIFVALGVLLSILVIVGFRSAYMRVYTHFAQQVVALSDSDVQHVANRLKDYSPYLRVGGHREFRSPADLHPLANPLRFRDPSGIRSFTYKPMKSDGTQRVHYLAAHYTTKTEAYIYLLLKIDDGVPRTRSSFGELDESMDHLEVDYWLTSDHVETRSIVLDAAEVPLETSTKMVQNAIVSAYKLTRGTPPQWDSKVGGAAYWDLEENTSYVLVRLKSTEWVQKLPFVSIRWIPAETYAYVQRTSDRRSDGIQRIVNEHFGERPTPNLDSLELRVPEGARYLSSSWPSPVTADFDACKPSWSAGKSVWLARWLLHVDFCDGAATAVAAIEKEGITIDGDMVRISHNVSGGEGGVSVVGTYSLKQLLARWKEYSDGQFIAFGWPLFAIVVLTVLAWSLVLRRIRSLGAALESARADGKMHLPGRQFRVRDEVGFLAYSIRATFRLARRQHASLARTNKQLTEQNITLQRLHEQLLVQNSTLMRLRKQISHEVRNPIQPLIALNADNPDAMFQINRIRYAVEDILEDAAGVNAREVKDGDVNSYIVGWVAAKKKYGRETAISLEPADQPCLVRLNFEALEDALDHIYSNALDFRFRNSPIDVRVAHHGFHVSISITNRGPQIPEDRLPNIFDYGSSTRAGANSEHIGQGLARVKSLVSRMSGAVSVHNTADGVEFSITLPLIPAHVSVPSTSPA